MTEWSFLTNHARALVCIARDPGVRLREIADELGLTERRAFGIVNDLSEAGYVVKAKDGRRNRYRIQDHLPLPDAVGRERTIGAGIAIEREYLRPLPAEGTEPVPDAPSRAETHVGLAGRVRGAARGRPGPP